MCWENKQFFSHIRLLNSLEKKRFSVMFFYNGNTTFDIYLDYTNGKNRDML